MARFLLIVGTRPESIKLAPLAHVLGELNHDPVICTTGQHPELARTALAWFGLKPDLELTAGRATLDQISATLISVVADAIASSRPDWVIVQGDTASAFAGAFAAHLARRPVAHVEAGLRSGDRWNPWPEESNRKLIAQLADLHFAPTKAAAAALRAENLAPGSIHVTGNTGLDALRLIRAGLPRSAPCADGRRRILVTCHRRESFGAPMIGIASAIRRIAARGDVALTLSLHPNPAAGAMLAAELADCPNVELKPPLAYPDFVAALAAAHLVLTDSGGVQEEAPALGIPALVLRTTTERPEGIAAGTARLVGTDPDRIVTETARLLDKPDAHAAMARAHNPYGDGYAAKRIAAILDAAL
jgi:UDP-N-acetylglucosamine 2-epimerase (non-hydrolysing)